jgi:hypothetical protein
VGVVLPDGRVELHSVMLGRDLGANVEILSGIGANDKVIMNPTDSLISGAHVRMADSTSKDVAERTAGGEPSPVGVVHVKPLLDN